MVRGPPSYRSPRRPLGGRFGKFVEAQKRVFARGTQARPALRATLRPYPRRLKRPDFPVWGGLRLRCTCAARVQSRPGQRRGLFPRVGSGRPQSPPSGVGGSGFTHDALPARARPQRVPAAKTLLIRAGCCLPAPWRLVAIRFCLPAVGAGAFERYNPPLTNVLVLCLFH